MFRRFRNEVKKAVRIGALTACAVGACSLFWYEPDGYLILYMIAVPMIMVYREL